MEPLKASLPLAAGVFFGQTEEALTCKSVKD